jgi:uncharacterized spore protein YtfJ
MDVQQVLGGAQDVMAAKRVYGEPYEKNGVTVIPAAKVAGGGGGGGDTEGNGGGGFGLSARPAGAWIVKGDSVRWQPAVDATKIAIMGQLVALAAIVTLRSVLRRPKARFELPRPRLELRKPRFELRKPALPRIVRKRLK